MRLYRLLQLRYYYTRRKLYVLVGCISFTLVALSVDSGAQLARAQLQFKNFTQHVVTVAAGITIYEYSTETTLLIDDDTEFDDPSTLGAAYSGSYSSANFKAGEDDVVSVNDTTDHLKLNHYGDNEPDTTGNGDWWDDDSDATTKYNWRYRRCFDVDHTATGATNLTDFQVYTQFDSETLITDSKMESDGSDIRFIDSNGNELEYYLNQGINSSETGAWILMDNIDAATTETICMYYGYVGAGSATAMSSMEDVFTYATGQDIYYVLQSDAVGDTVYFGSYTDNNDVDFNGTTYTFTNAYDTDTDNSAYTETDVFNVEGPIHGAFDTNGADAIAPISWAGTDFVYDAPRGTDEFDIFAPYATASVDIEEYDGTSWTNLRTENVTVGTVSSFTEDVANGRAYRFTSDEPIMVSHEAGNRDTHLLYPYDQAYNSTTNKYELFGYSEKARIAADTTVDCDVDYYASDGTTGTLTLDSAAFYSAQLNLTGSEGTNPQVRFESDCPIGGLAYGDGDGGEAVVFLPKKEWDDIYLVVHDTQYAAAAMDTASTDCRMYDNTDALDDTDTSGTETHPNVNAIYFPSNNNTADTIRYTAGYYIQCDAAVSAFYENRQAAQEETNWLNAVQGRKGAAVKPTVDNAGAANEEGLYYESGRDSGGAGTDPEGYIEIIIDSDDEHTFWFSVEGTATNPAQVSTNSVTPLEGFGAYANEADCSAATYSTEESIGTAATNYIDDEFSDNECIRIRVYLRTGDEAYSPELESLTVNYFVPTELEDVLNTPTVTVAGNTSGTAIRQRILKLTTTNTDLTGSDTFLSFRSISNSVPFTILDTEFLEIPSQTVTSQFTWPPFPGSETDASNTSPFDSSNELAVYIDHDRTAGSTETVGLRVTTDVEDADGPFITRDIDVEISG